MKKYGSLRFVAGFHRVLAWIVLISGALLGLIAMIIGIVGGLAFTQMPGIGALMGPGGALGGVLMGLLICLAALLYFVLLQAVSDSIYVGLAIEENTRQMAAALRGQGGAPVSPRRERPPFDE